MKRVLALPLVISVFVEPQAFGFVMPHSHHKAQLTWLLKGDFFDDIAESESDISGGNEYAAEERAPNQSQPDENFIEMSLDELEATAPEWEKNIPSFCSVSLVGRVGNDPEPRYFDSGKVVVNLSLACKRKYHSLERQALQIQEDATEWYNLEIWGKTAEFVGKYVTKGARIGVLGSFTVDSWNDRETGELRRKPVIIVRELEILESKAEAELRRQNRQNQPRKSFFTDDSDEDEDTFSAGTGGFF
mmetsp:Transcript_19867/g.29854  ORF Transcript_19867/g.29854 Transcript_19867/m.29854 type:complete len:246 (+) Transcript_19867:315-1052(+)|eukprot:CAMPEP_0178899788 /NCGR_PEP_ID=MMETSP0786-20121207/3102_1 /TAXON_ID=186022 /ORGANISM="Thalassionema frauenfeldii, Strain CCMP 1798" /LENGTH=245 /DNA_ID=CAMNT_0020570699 /DNA_START=2453 /DNA_END=3190 /DNA_ORIENTATION=+